VDFQVPGMLGIALLWLGLFGTALPLVQQREAKVLRRLSVTPLQPAALLTAQVAWRVTVALLQAALFLLVGYVGFGVQVEGSWPLLVGAVALGALVFITLGTFLAGVASSAEAVSAIVQVVNLPMMMLSGSLMAVESLPDFFRPVVAAMPLTYLSDALRQIIVAAPPLHPLWVDFAALGAWLVLFFVLATRLWRWE
jgi:ABC-2 type transport system permease protein